MRDAANIRQVEPLVHYMGFIFHPPSPRYVAEMPAYLPTACKRVGVFVDASLNDVAQKVKDYKLDAVQLHGNECENYCRAVAETNHNLLIIKALGIYKAEDVQATENYSTPHLFLFDTKTPRYGGSGKVFDWTLLQGYSGSTPFLLSGGLSAENMDSLFTFSHPQFVGVDLNSGFEVAPALKDADRLAIYINALKNNPQDE